MTRQGLTIAATRLFLSALALSLGSWAADTPAIATRKVDRILVLKAERTMQLVAGKDIIKTYKIALGTQPVGAKQKQGDRKTPEGNYVINGKNPHSQFHRSLRISYPNAADRERAKKQKIDPGGDIMIHGIGEKFGWLWAMHRQTDWTWGCIAVTNEEIEEIWKLVPIGTPIEIRP
jgi:murein L,D-transpeptidase YafK